MSQKINIDVIIDGKRVRLADIDVPKAMDIDEIDAEVAKLVRDHIKWKPEPDMEQYVRRSAEYGITKNRFNVISYLSGFDENMPVKKAWEIANKLLNEGLITE